LPKRSDEASAVAVYSQQRRSSVVEITSEEYFNMDGSPCCSKEGLNRAAWTKTEDMILSQYIRVHGDRGGWTNLAKKAGKFY